MKRVAILFGVIVTFATSALGCEQDSIESVAGDGRVIVTLSSGTYLVDTVDQITSALWLPATDILVCDDEKIINVDDREEVSVSRVP